MSIILDLADLAAVATTPSWFGDRLPALGQSAIVVDATVGVALLSAGETAAIASWLKHLPCPSIAIASDRSSPIAEAFDVVVADPADAVSLITAIECAPLAAMVLVQTLRVTPALPLADALLLESLAYATLQGGPEFRRWSGEHPPVPATGPRDNGPAVEIDRVGDRLDLRLNRPSRHNALSVEMRDAVVEALELVGADPSIEDVTLRGNGRCFSVGGDLAEFGTAPDPATAHLVRSLRLPARALASVADRVAVHLHGACIGAGCELPAFARRVTAAPNTFFQLPELRFGLIPGAGGCVSLPRRIGRQRTAWLALSGRRISAATALAWGLVDAVVD